MNCHAYPYAQCDEPDDQYVALNAFMEISIMNVRAVKLVPAAHAERRAHRGVRHNCCHCQGEQLAKPAAKETPGPASKPVDFDAGLAEALQAGMADT